MTFFAVAQAKTDAGGKKRINYATFGSIAQSGGAGYRYDYQGAYAEKDPVTGFNNFELRMYDGKIGRWLSVDPEGQFTSPYEGMGNNPIMASDPTGGFSWWYKLWHSGDFEKANDPAHKDSPYFLTEGKGNEIRRVFEENDGRPNPNTLYNRIGQSIVDFFSNHTGHQGGAYLNTSEDGTGEFFKDKIKVDHMYGTINQTNMMKASSGFMLTSEKGFLVGLNAVKNAAEVWSFMKDVDEQFTPEQISKPKLAPVDSTFMEADPAKHDTIDYPTAYKRYHGDFTPYTDVPGYVYKYYHNGLHR